MSFSILSNFVQFSILSNFLILSNYNFVSRGRLKLSILFQVKFNAKIRNDWKIGTHKEQTNNAPGLVSSARIYENGRKIICGADESIFVVDSLTSNRLLTLPGHNSIVNSVDLFSIKDE